MKQKELTQTIMMISPFDFHDLDEIIQAFKV